MSDWLHNLPLIWMALVVFAVTFLFAALLQALIGILGVDERLRATAGHARPGAWLMRYSRVHGK